MLILFSYFLWSISKPGKNGVPTVTEAEKENSNSIDIIITKTFEQYKIPLTVSGNIRATFKSKLWRMGKLLSKLGGTKRALQLQQWKDSTWNLCVSDAEIKTQVLKRQNAEVQLNEESSKRQKLEVENKKLKNTVQKQAEEIAGLRSGTSTVYRRASKSWSKYSRQQKYNIKKQLATRVSSALSFCDEKTFIPCKVEMKNVDDGTYEVLNISTGSFESRPDDKSSSDTNTALYLKDKLAISNTGYHELSMISNLPSSSQIRKCTKELNEQFDIRNAPDGIVGVQQSLKTRLQFVLTNMVNDAELKGAQIPDTIRVKLTGDGTQIAKGLSVVNFAFIILEGDKAMSVKGNHSLAILKVSESNDDELFRALKDII